MGDDCDFDQFIHDNGDITLQCYTHGDNVLRCVAALERERDIFSKAVREIVEWKSKIVDDLDDADAQQMQELAWAAMAEARAAAKKGGGG